MRLLYLANSAARLDYRQDLQRFGLIGVVLISRVPHPCAFCAQGWDSKALSLLGFASFRVESTRGQECPRHTSNNQRLATTYIPGNFIPAMRRAKLGLPICLNIFFICAYWRSRLLTSCTLVPEPRAMRLRRLPLIDS